METKIRLSENALALFWNWVSGLPEFLTDEELEPFEALGTPKECIEGHKKRRDTKNIYLKCSGAGNWNIDNKKFSIGALLEILIFCDFTPEDMEYVARQVLSIRFHKMRKKDALSYLFTKE